MYMTIKKATLLPTIMITLIATSVIAQNPLMIPDTLTGNSISLTLQNGTHQFYSGQNTTTMGANGSVLGPTLLLNQGDFVSFSVNNQLADSTTIHWHGLHVAPENDGGPHTVIPPSAIWNPSFTILDKAATYWYHPHLHSKTNLHVSKGIAGMLLVRDSDEAAILLPRKYGIDDFPLVIQTKDFDGAYEIVVPSNSDDVVMVNATLDPELHTPAQVVRFRLLNGSSQRVFNLGLGNGQQFYQIASDGGLLAAPIALTRLLIAPGERAEILIDFTGMNGQTVFLKSFASEFPSGIYGATIPGMAAMLTLTGYDPNPLNGSDYDVLQFTIEPATSSPVTSIPASLVTVTPIPEANANITRTLTFTPVTMGPGQLNDGFLINSAPFDMAVINETIPLNNTEIWELTNQSGISHPFHIHDVQFYILDRDGNNPPANEQGRKDVVLVRPQETVRFIAKFEDFSNNTVPYMYHCHMLVHEDGGMMGQFVVVDSTLTAIEKNISSHEISVFPNPSNGEITIQLDVNEPIRLELVNLLGENVLNFESVSFNSQLTLSSLPEGVLLLSITTAEGCRITKKVIVR
jgi:bilirubin oxidase